MSERASERARISSMGISPATDREKQLSLSGARAASLSSIAAASALLTFSPGVFCPPALAGLR